MSPAARLGSFHASVTSNGVFAGIERGPVTVRFPALVPGTTDVTSLTLLSPPAQFSTSTQYLPPSGALMRARLERRLARTAADLLGLVRRPALP